MLSVAWVEEVIDLDVSAVEEVIDLESQQRLGDPISEELASQSPALQPATPTVVAPVAPPAAAAALAAPALAAAAPIGLPAVAAPAGVALAARSDLLPGDYSEAVFAHFCFSFVPPSPLHFSLRTLSPISLLASALDFYFTKLETSRPLVRRSLFSVSGR